jgi:prepilin peptidase CpaA
VLPYIVVATAGAIAAVTDVWKFKVHNWLTLPLLIAGLLYHSMAAQGQGIGFSLLGIGFGFSILLLFYVIGGVGAGDVKLLAGCGAWLGLHATFYLFVFAGLATGVYAVGLLLWHGGVMRTVVTFQIIGAQTSAMFRHLGPNERVEEVVANKDDRRKRLIPFAAMVAVGFMAFLIWNHWEALPIVLR